KDCTLPVCVSPGSPVIKEGDILLSTAPLGQLCHYRACAPSPKMPSRSSLRSRTSATLSSSRINRCPEATRPRNAPTSRRRSGSRRCPQTLTRNSSKTLSA
ncbi:unnamed protein product, partial [Ectocarpus sp. 13 AM-2016]